MFKIFVTYNLEEYFATAFHALYYIYEQSEEINFLFHCDIRRCSINIDYYSNINQIGQNLS